MSGQCWCTTCLFHWYQPKLPE
ncbi:MAG: cyclic lactone autoinducer peptide [Syntrophomonadaceae bacterium]